MIIPSTVPTLMHSGEHMEGSPRVPKEPELRGLEAHWNARGRMQESNREDGDRRKKAGRKAGEGNGGKEERRKTRSIKKIPGHSGSESPFTCSPSFPSPSPSPSSTSIQVNSFDSILTAGVNTRKGMTAGSKGYTLHRIERCSSMGIVGVEKGAYHSSFVPRCLSTITIVMTSRPDQWYAVA
ncbi:hypothetical protein GYMLUDRAFT_263614 [Collybiopsis luxurians FD-317 M1]|uniref:Uncharacterized protein n=1 Tax=Collybiopsis luxurians FD-317 M1 TaxID=944289 RepID=A0A0D0BNI6_9AGAR|nr:hypothetical protein GYMLUDRAFT_263614 [Collybiopsis luxurians FD-317 M1]